MFEVIKTAITSVKESEGVEEPEAEEEEEEQAEEVKPPKEEAMPVVKKAEFSFEELFTELVRTLTALPQNQQLLLAFVVLYFVSRMLFRKRDPAAERIENLSKQVDDLTNEVMEMKAMLESVLKLSEQKLDL